MNTCDTCKFWMRQISNHDFTTMQNKCGNPRVAGRLSPRYSDENILMLSGTTELAEHEGLFTGPQFGCVHWRQK